jgi:hypothetical protein
MDIKKTTKVKAEYTINDLKKLFSVELDAPIDKIKISKRVRYEEYQYSNTESDSIEHFDGLIVEFEE